MCAEIVKDCGGGAVTLSRRALGAAERLREWLSTPWSDLVPAPLALRPEARLSATYLDRRVVRTGQLQAVEPNSLRLISPPLALEGRRNLWLCRMRSRFAGPGGP
jgi:hypothetical protein